LDLEALELEQWLQDNGQLYVSPATRQTDGGVINWQLDTKKAALRPL
jgi:hypothetical protein